MKKQFIITTSLLLTFSVFCHAGIEIPKEKIRSDSRMPIHDNITLPKKTCDYILKNKIDADYIILPRIVSRLDFLEKAKQDSLAKLVPEWKNQIVTLEEVRKGTQTLLSNAGKPFDSKQKALIEVIYQTYKNGVSGELRSYIRKSFQNSNQRGNLKAIWKNASMTTQGPLSEKDCKSIEKDMNKGIIPKKLKNHFEIYDYDCLIKIDSLTSLTNTYPEQLYRDLGWDNWDAPQEKYHDTIPNPMMAEVCESNFLDGWEWLNEEYEDARDSYPYSIHYRKYRSHPDYKVLPTDSWWNKKLVFTKDGKLVYATGIGTQDDVSISDDGFLYYNTFDRNRSIIGEQFARFAYEQNAYDIKSQSAKINHYIKTQLRLEELTVAEKRQRDKSADAMASAIIGHSKSQMRHGNSRKGKQQQRKYAGQFLGALLGSGRDYYSPEGNKWLNQIQEDTWTLLKDDNGNIHPLKMKRLDEKTFVYYYGNKNGEILYRIIYGFKGTKPFEYEFSAKVEKHNPQDEPTRFEKLDDEYALSYTIKAE